MIRAVFLDMDGVLFDVKNFWMKVHEVLGTEEDGHRLSELYLDTDYARLVEEVVEGLWKGMDAAAFVQLAHSLPYMEGVEEFFDYIHKNDIYTAIISGGSKLSAIRVQKDFGVDEVCANELIINDGVITGDFVWPVAGARQEKAKIMLEIMNRKNLKPEECAYVGDSEKDIDAFREVGFAVAFNADSDELKQAADIVINSKNLDDVTAVLKDYPNM